MDSAIQAVDSAIKKIQKQMSAKDANSNLPNLIEKHYELLKRRELLMTYLEDMLRDVKQVDTETNQQIKKLEEKRKQRIAEIRQKCQKKVAALSSISGSGVKEIQKSVIKPQSPEITHPMKIVDETVLEFKEYIKMHSNVRSTVNNKDNFFRAIIFSAEQYNNSTISENNVQKWLLGAQLKTNSCFPLSLTNVDRIIHLESFKAQFFGILDTSLSVILSNFAKPKNNVRYLLIYNFESNQFAPLPLKTNTVGLTDGKDEEFCRNCFCYQSNGHQCKPHCPICLRVGYPQNTGCFKTKAAPLICTKCAAFCQTIKCFNAHAKICPRPLTKLQKNAVKLIQILKFD